MTRTIAEIAREEDIKAQRQMWTRLLRKPPLWAQLILGLLAIVAVEVVICEWAIEAIVMRTK